MADGEDSDKTEEPTEHKLQEARKKGQVMKSQEVISVFLLIATAGILSMTGSSMIRNIMQHTRHLYGLISTLELNNRNLYLYGMEAAWVFAKAILPILAAAFITGILANVAQIKFLFSTDPLTPRASKISPIEGLKRIISMRALMELAKQLAKLLIVGYVAYKIVKKYLFTLRKTPLWELGQTLVFVKAIMFKVIWYVVLALIIIAIADYLFQRKMFMKQMRMSIKELKDEYKDTEGDPNVKAKIKQLQRQAATARMMEEVPNSSAVITNPIHLAVAIKYEHGKMDAPIVVAKGERLIAQRIKEIAEEHDIVIVENVTLAKALFSSCEIGQIIPVELYKAVAEVLAFVYKLKRKRSLVRRRRAYSPYRKKVI